MKTTWLTTTLLILFAVTASQAADNMKAFPPAEEGMVRYVLQLPKQDDESVFKVELIIGKTIQVDERNRYFFSGKIEEETIKGWGFPRYNVSELGPMAGTLMAVDPNLIRYNSRLPIVVYVPESVEVRYRIWKAKADVKAMERG